MLYFIMKKIVSSPLYRRRLRRFYYFLLSFYCFLLNHYYWRKHPILRTKFNRYATETRLKKISIIEPIDIVYTWVDSSDPAWQEAFQLHYNEALASPTAKSYIIGDIQMKRWQNRDELKYSLRSLEKNLKINVRKIHIVTMSQTPDFLNTTHPKINLVDLSSIMDPKHLPTFSSSAITANLHKIEDLSEHFIYIQDDMFFGNTVSIDDFYYNNKMALLKIEWVDTFH